MTCQHAYLASLDSISTPVPSNVWFATWSSGGSVTWTQSPKPSAGDGVNTFAVALQVESSPRTGVIALGNPKTMPPPMANFTTTSDIDDFKGKFIAWTEGDRSFEIPA